MTPVLILSRNSCSLACDDWLGLLKVPIWVGADGAYAKQEFLKPARSMGMTVVSRLRKDAGLRTLPGPKPSDRRGPDPTYGLDRNDLAKRAGQRRGWATETFTLYGKPTAKRYKTFVATWRPAGGAIRVVLVDEPTGWVAFFCTDPSASVADILESVAARFSLEVTFRDRKDVVGAGQQQVRWVRANVGAFHVCLWTFTLTEAWAWGPGRSWSDRTASPWDDGSRRPSHADKRRAWRRELLGGEIRAVLRPGLPNRKSRPPPTGCSPGRVTYTYFGKYSRLRCPDHCRKGSELGAVGRGPVRLFDSVLDRKVLSRGVTLSGQAVSGLLQSFVLTPGSSRSH